MKIKLTYIYIAAFVFIVAALVIFSPDNSTEKKDFSSMEIPNDEMREGTPPTEQPPSKSNVSESVLHEMEKLKIQIDENPSDTLSMRKYAELLSAGHRADEAVDYYEKILTINKRREDILSALTFLYFDLRKFNEAEKTVERILKVNPKSTEALFNLGAISANKGNTAKARKVWKDLIEKYPESDEADLARSYIKKLR
ncbi:MAG: tetratricopeptide repeat protein [Chlorobi bacterium]|nr:tetratricopeptide repeat protein [Chlorobiota bacterium]